MTFDLADLLSVGFRKGAPKNREILAEEKDEPSVDHSVARDNTVTSNLLLRHAEVGAAMLDEHVPLFKAAFIEEDLDALSSSEFSFGVLFGDSGRSAPHLRGAALFLQLRNDVLHWVLFDLAVKVAWVYLTADFLA